MQPPFPPDPKEKEKGADYVKLTAMNLLQKKLGAINKEAAYTTLSRWVLSVAYDV